MKINCAWADELVMICTAIFLGKNIWQISCTSKKERPWLVIPGKIPGWPIHVKKPPLRIFNINLLHFEALVFKDHSVSA